MAASSSIPTSVSVEGPNDLPETRTYITGHDASKGKAIVNCSRPATWQGLGNNGVGFNVVYTTSEFPSSLSDDRDLASHDTLLAAGTLGLVRANGTVYCIVGFEPGNRPLMDRTQSLDYGIVLEGTVKMMLDSGEVKALQRHDARPARRTGAAWLPSSEIPQSGNDGRGRVLWRLRLRMGFVSTGAPDR